jgi:hypothetical protein
MSLKPAKFPSRPTKLPRKLVETDDGGLILRYHFVPLGQFSYFNNHKIYPQKFFQYYMVSATSFDELLGLIGEYLAQKLAALGQPNETPLNNIQKKDSTWGVVYLAESLTGKLMDIVSLAL